MRKVWTSVLLVIAAAISAGAQDNEDGLEKLYYVDVSVGYSMALPTLSSSSSNPYALRGHDGGSMSFSFNRVLSGDWALQLEVLSTSFGVKKADFLAADGIVSGNYSELSFNPYRSTFVGVGAYYILPLAAALQLDIKASAGLNLVDYAKQSYIIYDKPSSNTFDASVSSKRSYAPGALVGARLRYPISDVVVLGAKVEYGISYARFTELTRDLVSNTGSGAVVPVSESLPDVKKTLSYLNAGVTLGVRF